MNAISSCGCGIQQTRKDLHYIMALNETLKERCSSYDMYIYTHLDLDGFYTYHEDRREGDFKD